MAVGSGGERIGCGGAVRLLLLVRPWDRDALEPVESSVLGEVAEARPHVVLVDGGPSAHCSRHLVERLKQVSPETRVVVTNLEPAQPDVLEFVTAGASGFILSDATVDDLFRTIRLVADGMDVVPTALTGALLEHAAQHANSRVDPGRPDSIGMTRREQEVVQLIADGLSNKEIAQRLHIATNTVKGHVHNILEKLALRTRLQVSIFARGARASGSGVP